MKFNVSFKKTKTKLSVLKIIQLPQKIAFLNHCSAKFQQCLKGLQHFNVLSSRGNKSIWNKNSQEESKGSVKINFLSGYWGN